MVTAPADPFAPMRSRQYLRLLVLAAILGAPISAIAFWFLKLVALLEGWVFTSLPKGLGFHGEPIWWPLLPLGVAGVLVGAVIRYLPGKGGHSPADGFKAGGVARPIELPGIFAAAAVTLGLGVVLGPEAPLIAIGGGLAFLAVKLINRDVPATAGAVVAAAGSFAAISTLFGSPLAAAFLLLEASGLGGAMATIALLPGLLGAGIGALIFLGLNSLTGYGTFSLAIQHLPPFHHVDIGQFGWAIVLGVAAAFAGYGIKRIAFLLRGHLERRLLLLTPLAGLAIAGLAIAYAEGSGHPASDVLFSGQSFLGPLITHAAAYSAGALLLLIACKGIGYAIALSGFRGGPTFPAMLVGAAGGIVLSHAPGLPVVPAAAIGIGAMAAAMLRLPMTSVLITTLFLGSDGITVLPLVIVGVVVSFVLTIWLVGPPAAPKAHAATQTAPQPASQPVATQVR
jgi:H+/Cl- antiporter ClcA